ISGGVGVAGTSGRATTDKAGRAEPMSESKPPAQSIAQAGSTGEAAGVGSAVGGVRSRDDLSWLDLWALNPETRAYLKSYRRDAACSQASSRREGAGDGSPEIATPEKLRHLQDTLYRKAKAEPGYRFWSLYGELTRRDLLEHALRLVVRNGRLEVVDADLSKYFDTIPHDRLMKLVARRTSDGSLLHLIRQWLDAPVAEENGNVLPNRQGVPQGGVISPLLANLYLNALDWAVNDPA